MQDLKEAKIVTMLRIKNESRWIVKVLESISSFSTDIVVLDDGSTDNTLEICKNFSQVVDIHQQSNLPFDETRDKNILLKMALKRNPDFVLTLDGDEIFPPNIKKLLLEELEVIYPEAPMYEFQVLTIWDKLNQYRYDGIYSNIWAKKLIRLSKQPEHLHFEGTDFPNNAHCPAVPQNANGWSNSIRSKVKIFHYGNYDHDLRQQKYKFYATYAPDSKIFDNYVHIISGNGKWSGPHGMEFKSVPENAYVKNIK